MQRTKQQQDIVNKLKRKKVFHGVLMVVMLVCIFALAANIHTLLPPILLAAMLAKWCAMELAQIAQAERTIVELESSEELRSIIRAALQAQKPDQTEGENNEERK